MAEGWWACYLYGWQCEWLAGWLAGRQVGERVVGGGQM